MDDPLAALRASLANDPVTRELIGDADPDGDVRGTLRERYFFRRAAGDGWVLVGDAGHHKDFVIGDGITEALIQAESLAKAIGRGTDEAVVRWWRERDVEALPLYHWGREEGRVGRPGMLQRFVIARVGRDPELARRMTRLPEHRSSPYDVLPFRVVLDSLAAALLRGKMGVIPEFFAQGRRASGYQRELAARSRLIE
jgi:flavin-dependent dehydrogenase